MEQDPLFSFRIMVDIGLKALSPAINDPTTAVLAIDQIHRLLRVVGKRQLRGETIADRRGRPRVIFGRRTGRTFVHSRVHRDSEAAAPATSRSRGGFARCSTIWSPRCPRIAAPRSKTRNVCLLARSRPPIRWRTISRSRKYRTRKGLGGSSSARVPPGRLS